MNHVTAAVSAEFLKLRRTVALRVAIAAPLAVVGLQVLVATQQSAVVRAGATPLLGLLQGGYFVWALLALPLYGALAAALVAAVDHQDDHWKQLFSLPIPRWSIFAGKWVAAVTLLLISFAVLAIGLLTLTAVFRELRPGWPAQPELLQLAVVRMGESFLAAWFFLSIQLWVSLRWRSFPVGLTVGIIAVLVTLGLAARGGGRNSLTRLYPWALPVTAIARIAETTPSRTAAAVRGSLGGVLVGAAACWTLGRREWS